MADKCYCDYNRCFLITWICIKLILLILAAAPLYVVLFFGVYYGNRFDVFMDLLMLITYPTALGFNIALLSAAYTRETKTLDVCYFYLIFELVIALLLVPWIFKIFFHRDTLHFLLLKIGVVTVLTLVQGILSIRMLDSEIKQIANESQDINEEIVYGTINGDNQEQTEKRIDSE